jgi:hypothetical protein
MTKDEQKILDLQNQIAAVMYILNDVVDLVDGGKKKFKSDLKYKLNKYMERGGYDTAYQNTLQSFADKL